MSDPNKVICPNCAHEFQAVPWNVQAEIARLRKVLDAEARNRNRILDEQEARIEKLEEELDNERARGIHSCGPKCQRPLCVAQRRIVKLEAALQRIATTESVGAGAQYPLRDIARYALGGE